MILAIPAVLLILALIVAPQLWIMSVMKRHGQQRPIIPWTGGEFARHLLDGMKLTKVKVEETQEGDHYHPLAKAVRLKTDHYFGRSLTAIVIAAHEVGHAMQDATGYAPLQTRTRVAETADFIHKIGAVLIIASPVLAAVLRHPGGLVIGLGAAVLMNLVAVVMHAVTLPVEFDASFNRAMVVLNTRQIHSGKRDGRGPPYPFAAYTYVAAALMDLINLPRLLRGLRF